MDKYFICLANSYKHGGRCVAGIEINLDKDGRLTIVRDPDGKPHWIRPIANTQFGSIPNHIAATIPLFSVVKLMDVDPCPDKAHVENMQYSQMVCRPYDFKSVSDLLSHCIDPVHQAVFYFRGKAIPAQMVERLNYSLMLIKPENAHAFIDEEREKSKYRMKFSYYGSNYDFPITDPEFIEALKKNPEHYSDLKNIYLTLSLGLEFEGFHFKLVAAVFFTENSTPSIQEETDLEHQNWFDTYENELVHLIDQKKALEEQINAVRARIINEMEQHGVEKVESRLFSVSYTPERTVMQFDSRAFRTENEELYSSYCRPKQKEASIVVRRKRENEE